MDKARKLRRYRRKDYSRLVDFPVEIVGRDGVVRNYTFEESVRLYQRRIATAFSRYSDAEVAQAEADHCRRRVRQLRRSYLDRHGWPSLRLMAESDGAFGEELAAELGAFVKRAALDEGVDPETWALSPVAAEDEERVFMLSGGDERHLLVYLYRLGSQDDSPGRRRFEVFLQALSTLRDSGDSERLLAAHRTDDCGILLTGGAPGGHGEDVELPLPAPDLDGFDDHGEGREPFLLAVEELGRGSAGSALERLDAILQERPEDQQAALVAAMAADLAGRFQEAEFYARLGTMNHPGHAALRHQLGLALVRQQRVSEARVELMRCLQVDPMFTPARLLLAAVELRAGRHRHLDRLLEEARELDVPGHREVVGMVRRLQRRIAWRRRGLTLAGLAGLASLAALAKGHMAALLALGLSVTVALAIAWATRIVRSGGKPDPGESSAPPISA